MIILLFKLVLITSILVLGYTIVTQEGMAFHWLRKWAEKKEEEEGNKFVSPIFLCSWCQPSSFSLLGFSFAYGLGIINNFQWNYIFLYVLTVGLSSLVCGLTWTIYETINTVKDRNNAEEDYYRVAIESQIDDEYFEDEEDENKKKEYFESINN